MASYAATINIRHISTSKGSVDRPARKTLSVGGARKAALDNLSYATRASKTDDLDIIGHTQGETMIAENAADREAMRDMSRWAIDARAEKHTDANGVRLADKMIVSLPADASPEHHREMVGGILSDLGGDSDAWLVAAIHRDRAGNPHAHILAIDGLETRETAQARRPDAQRIRRRDQLRLNEGGNRPELRQRIAAQINLVADREGYRRAEVRSLADQGIDRAAPDHEGPQGSARRTRRRNDREIRAWLDAGDSGGWDAFEDMPPPVAPAPPSRPSTPPRAPSPATGGPAMPPVAPSHPEPARKRPAVPVLAENGDRDRRIREAAEGLARRRAEEAAQKAARAVKRRRKGQDVL